MAGTKDVRELLCKADKIVVKVGTSSLTHKTGKLNINGMEKLVRQLADLYNAGKSVILVTSGAVGAGMGRLNLTEKPTYMAQKQALAAIGQGILMQIYEKLFGEHGINVAQVLLSKEDFSHRGRYLNARNTFGALWDYGVIPIVNENDTIAFEEIKLGDNDTLAALVSTLVSADLLVLLSDIDGLYTANPRTDKNARHLDVVEEITADIQAMAGGTGSNLGTGGMMTKIQAATIACGCGIPMVLTDSCIENVLNKITKGESNGTVFLPRERSLNSKKGWLAFGSQPVGKVFVDKGAAEAIIEKGSSLLAKGIKGVEGCFAEGDIVAVVIENAEGEEIARGLTNYGAEDIRLITGCHSSEIPQILTGATALEVIHRDQMSMKK
ncbi:MAG: glutamate 5-kinase [Clostridia bacterium]|jgi:glutamate 5-kinase|nr:glutamate 5-kinase [Clostridia bacterium]MDD4572372.1 glutamate 5-kinase [Clostridia bacterium]